MYPEGGQGHAWHRWVVLVLGLAGANAAPRSTQAQSLTSASLAGTVRDDVGRPLYDAAVTVAEQSSGMARRAVTSRDGQFMVSALPPGRYDVFAEVVGYRPRRVLNVPVFPGNVINLAVTLVAAPPPVDRVDTTSYSGVTVNGRGTGMSERFTSGNASDFADHTGDVNDVLRHSSAVSELATDGLPGARRTLLIDGVPFVPARHPASSGDRTQVFAFPLSGTDRVELLTNPVDAELAGADGGLLSLETRRGTTRFRFDAFGDWSDKTGSSSRYFRPRDVRHETWRAGGVLTGPIVRDTGSFAIGVEARRSEAVGPSLARTDSAYAAVLAVARDSFGEDLDLYGAPHLRIQSTVTGFARLDWQLAANHALSARGNFGKIEETAPDMGTGSYPALLSGMKGTDFSSAGVLTSLITPRIAQELRIGVSGSTRDYSSGTIPTTLILDPSLVMGSDAAFPGRFQRTEVHVSDLVHIGLGGHSFKVGAEGGVASLVDAYAEGRTGFFTFADAQRFALLQGAFQQTMGPVPSARFTLPRFAGIFQDSWRASPGLRLTLGVRLDYQRLPQAKVLPNDSLEAMTGLTNADLPGSTIGWSPRLGFSWDPGERGVFVIRGAAGVYARAADPAVLSETITNSGRVELRSALGALGSWPATPDPAVAPVRGRDITLAGPSAQGPRVSRFTLGISRALGRSAALHLSGSYSHADFLPRRHDLNLLAAPAFADAHGRPVYGSLQQDGSQLTVTPGSNRRFSAFNHIWALDADGFSDHWAGTAALERESASGLRLLASYTYSKTTDNWLSRPGISLGGQVTPFPAGLNDQDWAEGPSDYDATHRVTAGVALPAIPGLGARLSVLYSFRSGYPFTPGFRDGVDANGDGSSNDPAYIDDTVPETEDLFGAWPCLGAQAGRFAARNSCRSPGIHRLDARLKLATFRTRALETELLVDGLNLLDSGEGIPDRALYLVDAGGTLMTNVVTGVITVPVRTNPGFGQPLLRATTGRSFRIGLRMSL